MANKENPGDWLSNRLPIDPLSDSWLRFIASALIPVPGLWRYFGPVADVQCNNLSTFNPQKKISEAKKRITGRFRSPRGEDLIARCLCRHWFFSSSANLISIILTTAHLFNLSIWRAEEKLKPFLNKWTNFIHLWQGNKFFKNNLECKTSKHLAKLVQVTTFPSDGVGRLQLGSSRAECSSRLRPHQTKSSDATGYSSAEIRRECDQFPSPAFISSGVEMFSCSVSSIAFNCSSVGQWNRRPERKFNFENHVRPEMGWQ